MPSTSADITVNGIAMRAHLGDNYTEDDLLLGCGQDNGQELAQFLTLLQPGHVVVDIGANCGLYTLFAASRVGRRGRVIAIEPNPTLIERLLFNINCNRFENISVVRCAIGEAAATRALNVVVNNLGASSLHKVSQRVATMPMQVPVRPLLQVLTDTATHRIDVLKIDIEGYEDRALVPLFERAPPDLWPRAVMIETRHRSCWTVDVTKRMRMSGYRETWRGEHDCVLEKI